MLPESTDMTAIPLLATLFLMAMLLRLGVIDLQSRRLPNELTLPLLVMGLILNGYLEGGLPSAAIAGALAGFAAFWLIGTVYFRLRGVDGLGLGDAKLLAAAGAWLGLESLPVLVLLAAVAALLFTILRDGDARDPLAFGPWLAMAFFFLWVLRLTEEVV